DPNNVAPTAHRHEVDHSGYSAIATELRLQDHRVVAVTLPVLADRRRGKQGPATVLVVTHQRREACIRIKARRTQPVDRPAARNERAGEHISDQPVIFDFGRHALPFNTWMNLLEAGRMVVPTPPPSPFADWSRQSDFHASCPERPSVSCLLMSAFRP